jgi:uncharacterized C2H2 Zn-finger protein
MPNYKCERCLKEFGLKSDYTRHLNKKFPCKISPQNSTKIPQKSTQMECVTDNELKCNYCEKVFSRSDSLNRHISGYCKVKKANDAKMEELMERLIKIEESDKKNKEKIEKLEAENAKYHKIINNNTQNNINHQTNNNITFKIKAYGTEDTSKITVSEYKRIFGRGMNSTPALLEKLHFDKNTPENHNVYISNLRDEYVLMFDGKIWRLKDREDALQQLYEDKSDILETKFEELIERLDEPTIKMFKRFLKIKDDDDEKIKVIKKELKKVLYENREMVMNTKKKYDNLLME